MTTEQKPELKPQRFRWQMKNADAWNHGVCVPPFAAGECWHVWHRYGSSVFDDCPWEALKAIVDGCFQFQWLDNDYNWPGYDYPRVSEADVVKASIPGISEETEHGGVVA